MQSNYFQDLMSNFEVDFIEMARKELKNQTVIGENAAMCRV